jgi:YggT family protein
MSVIGTVLGFVLTVFVGLMIVRMVFDWVGLAGGRRSPWMSRARAVSYAGTEPVVGPVRRVLRPVRAGGMSIDLAFTVVFVLALILRSVAFSL